MYPPGRFAKRGPKSVNNLPTADLDRKILKARLRDATESDLLTVIKGSIYRRKSFAFGKVVLINSCLIKEQHILENIALRWLLVRLKLRPELR